MKNYQSTTEGTWIELLPVQLTEEQKTLMMSTKEEDKEAKKALQETIKSQREGSVPTKKKNELKAFYNSVKSELKEDDTYQLISIDLSEKEDKFAGILNCRVNGEHKQIRF
jgi:regulatory protein YycI of two-component signal transduction system YycFG